jgi:hypothetical protein
MIKILKAGIPTFIIFLYFSFNSCNKLGAGSFSGWNTIVFPVSNKQLNVAIDSLYNSYPSYNIPDKWMSYGESWKKQGYIRMKVYTFYFKELPEEMYYVSLVAPGLTEHPEYARIAVRGVQTADESWKENKNINLEERKRVEKRFAFEIISKLEQFTNSRSFVEK